MPGSLTIPSLDALKQQAKRLRARLAEDGDFINHSESLEYIAHQYGYRDWNTLHAAAGNRPAKLQYQIGERVRGAYLGQPITGTLVAVSTGLSGRRRVTIELDEAVDVVTFESFSAYRSRISGTVDKDGVSRERISTGDPQLVVEAF